MRGLNLYCIVALLLAGCSAAQIQQRQAVLITLKADAQTVLVTGCANAPAIEAVASLVMPLLPAGTDKDALAKGLAVAEPDIAEVCAKVTAMQPAPVIPAP